MRLPTQQRRVAVTGVGVLASCGIGRDAFWAAKIIMSFTPEELRAIVHTGKLTDPVQEQYFYDVLVARQEKCGRFGINIINPLDAFTLTGNALEFENLSEKYGFSPGGTRYRVSWSMYDNAAL